MIARLAGIPTGRRGKWLLVVIWLLVVAAVSPFAGKLTSVEKNDAAAWLPSNAESTKVNTLEHKFPDGQTMPAVIVYRDANGLTAADRAKVDADRQALAKRFPQWPLTPAIPSQDGKAVMYTVSLPSEGDQQANQVKDIRAVVGGGEGALDIKVTGPAGFLTDLIDVFSGPDILLFATVLVVALLLLITYRSPVLWLVPLIAVAFADQGATAAVYALAKQGWITVNGQGQGILPVLIFGAGTDYALLLIARYREELRRHEDKHEAMAFALRRGGPAVFASGGTVIIGLLCLLAAVMAPNKSLGPVGALGIAGALLAMLTLLPALLVVFGRRLFWPFVPHYGSALHEESGVWSRVGRWISGRARPVWIGTTVVLIVLAFGLVDLHTNLPQGDAFRTTPDAIKGQRLLAASYPAGASAPAVVIAKQSVADAVQRAIADTPGVAGVRPDGQAGDLVRFAATMQAQPGTQAAFDTVKALRANVHAVSDAGALVGGNDATSLDIDHANSHDRRVVMPLVLVVVLIVLALLLRAIVAPLLLTVTIVLSFAAALGASAFVFDHVFRFAGVDASIPLLGFVFLVALGIDYNIFLMSRVHEEAAQIGTRAGMLKGLAVTGGVITSAGIVLAATFAVLGVLPLVSMTELGFVVAFGVLLDTLVVRSILVPALTLDLDRRLWWPSRPAQRPAASDAIEERELVGTGRDRWS